MITLSRDEIENRLQWGEYRLRRYHLMRWVDRLKKSDPVLYRDFTTAVESLVTSDTRMTYREQERKLNLWRDLGSERNVFVNTPHEVAAIVLVVKQPYEVIKWHHESEVLVVDIFFQPSHDDDWLLGRCLLITKVESIVTQSENRQSYYWICPAIV